MRQSTVDEVARLVSRRRALLDELDAGTTAKAELVEALDSSRSTIDRAVRELESEGIVTRRHGQVELTLSGRLVLDTYRNFRDTALGVESAHPLLEQLPADAPLNPKFFDGATIVDADRPVPHRPISAIEEVIRRAGSVRSYAVSLVPVLLDAYVDQLTAGSLDLEIVVTDPVLDRLVADHTTALQSCLDTGHLQLFSREPCVPFGFLIADCPKTGQTGIVTAGDHGYVAIVKNDHEEAVAWLDSLYRTVVEDATPVNST